MSERSAPMATAFEAGDQREIPFAERQRRAELRAILQASRRRPRRRGLPGVDRLGAAVPLPAATADGASARAPRLSRLLSEPEYPNRHPDGFDPIDERLYIANVEPQVFDEIDAPVAVVFIYSWEHVRFLRRPRIVYEHLDSLDLLGRLPRESGPTAPSSAARPW